MTNNESFRYDRETPMQPTDFSLLLSKLIPNSALALSAFLLASDDLVESGYIEPGIALTVKGKTHETTFGISRGPSTYEIGYSHHKPEKGYGEIFNVLTGQKMPQSIEFDQAGFKTTPDEMINLKALVSHYINEGFSGRVIGFMGAELNVDDRSWGLLSEGSLLDISNYTKYSVMISNGQREINPNVGVIMRGNLSQDTKSKMEEILEEFAFQPHYNAHS